MKNKNFFHTIISIILLIGILSFPFSPLLAPKKADAAFLDGKKFLPGVAKGALTGAVACLAQVGAVWLVGKGVTQGERVESVPTASGSGNSQYASSSGKEFCLDAIATNLAKATLEKFTKATVAWINSGFEGDPLYVRDPASFFKGIANEQLGTITLSIQGSGAPFARTLAQSLILSNLNNFQNSMKYNIDSYMGSTRADQYRLDFEAGGWDAWLLQTQFPQNNPIGASINVANEATKQLAGTTKAVGEIAQEEINQGMGFVGLKECVNPVDWERGTGFVEPEYVDPFDGMSPEEFAELTPEEKAQIEKDASDSYLQYVSEQKSEYEKKHTCKRWETRTPGKAIADQLQTAMGSSFRQSELADELNESIAVVFDSLVSHFLTEGLNALGDTDQSGTNYASAGFGGYSTNSSDGGTYTNGSWISQTNTSSIYSIWTDIDKLLGWQNDYLVVLAQKRDKIENGILPKIYELDFCTPGPRPDWEEKARERVTQLTPGMKDYFGAQIGLAVYAGLTIGDDNADDLDKGEGMALFPKILESYTNLINKRWFDKNALLLLPTINTINKSEYQKITTYKSEIESVDDEILETKAVISRLNYIKEQLQGIPNPNTGGILSETQQETVNQQQRILDQIALLAATDGSIQSAKDDIILADSTIAYFGDQTKGLIGQCVDEVAALTDPGLKIRFKYPFDLLALTIQNSYTPGPAQTVVDPTGYPGPELREPTYLKNIPFASGLGFMDYVSYGSDGNCSPASPYIHVTDIINLTDCDTTAVFENTIGIY